jgi:hypothetical protein
VQSCSNNSTDDSADKNFSAKNIPFMKKNARKLVAAALHSLGPMKVPYSESVLPHLVVCLSLSLKIFLFLL